MDTTDKYLAVAVTLLFVVGIRLLVAAVRQQNRTHGNSGAGVADGVYTVSTQVRA